MANNITKFIHWQASSGVRQFSQSVSAVDSPAPVVLEPHVQPSTGNTHSTVLYKYKYKYKYLLTLLRPKGRTTW